MVEKQIAINCLFGLQGNRAIYFVKAANEFKSSIWIEYKTVKLNAKSLMGIMSMEIGEGESVILSADGPDESIAVGALEQLVQNDISEAEHK